MVDLVHFRTGKSLTVQCIPKKYTIDCIGSKKVKKSYNIDLTIVDNTHLRKGVISCILSDDLQTFVNQSMSIKNFGETLTNTEPYKPDHLEICLVFLPDEDGTKMWYR